ncbi:MAG: hypothetical protein ACR2L4_04745 [Actinomycetota bacterium]
MARPAEADRAAPAPGAPAAVGPRRSGLLGAIAGLIGIGCCVYPVALVLLGLSSTAAAVDLANTLFDEWGWAFKSAGTAFALTALWIQRGRARACPVDARPSLTRTVLWLAGAGLATYAAFYGFTTWLGSLAT